MKVGYQTASGMYEKGKKPPMPMASNSHRVATGNALVGGKHRTRTQQLDPLPGTAHTTEKGPTSAHTGPGATGSMRASSHFNPKRSGDSVGGSTIEKSKLNIVAKKRPPPMNIGFNANGIEIDRQVLYRNFHQI